MSVRPVSAGKDESQTPHRILVTGGAGFIGSNLVERLLAEGYFVTVVDNLSGGSRENLSAFRSESRFRFVEQDLLDLPALAKTMAGHEAVFHLAANSDISAGGIQTDTDLRLGTMATYNVLEAMRTTAVHELVFSSSSVVYGEPDRVPTAEDYGPLLPISLYGASKLACEGLISAYGHNYGIHAWILRFANICGRHATHGVILDFIRKLRRDPRRLEILGDGQQAKPYLHVGECVDAMLYTWRNARSGPLNVFNLGCDGATAADRIAGFLLEAMGLQGVRLLHSGGERGWPGDVPQVRLDCGRLAKLGWKATSTSDEAVRRAVYELVDEAAACKR